MMRGNLSNEEEIKRYLFRELSEDEAERFEERLFEDNDYFYDVLGMEDDLVDRYALGRLSGADLERFERSLRDSHARREKVAGAVALQRRMAEEKREAVARKAEADARVERQTFRQRLAAFFSPQSPALRYAAVGLMLLLTFGFVFLAAERYRLGRELAGLRDGHEAEARRREEDLQKQIDAALVREAELKRQIESERGRSQVLNEQLEGEGAERERLQRELEGLRHERGDRTSPAQTTIASVFLVPAGRGAGGSEELTIAKNVRRVAVGLELEEGLSAVESYGVELNGRRVATNVSPKRLPSGKLHLTVTAPPTAFNEGTNRLVVKNRNNLPVGDYELNVRMP
jgi:hypothetical protein